MKTYIILPDLHIPHHDKRALAVVEKYINWRQQNYGLAGLVQLGDIGDWSPVSRHTKSQLLTREGQRLERDFAEINDTLDRWQQLIPDGDLHLIEGNHEFWLEKYIDEHPELHGLFNVRNNLNLDSRGIHYHPFWTHGHRRNGICQIGKARMGHGKYTNRYHAAKHADVYGENFIYGHTHDVQRYSKPFLGDHRIIGAQSMGCLCDLNRDWMRGNPDNWQHAFGVMHVQPNGKFNLYVVEMFNHKFVSPEGEKFS